MTNLTNFNKTINTISTHWNKKSFIMSSKFNFSNFVHNDNYYDYPLELLPFYSLNNFKNLPLDDKKTLSRLGWLIYLDSSLVMEKSVVIPNCLDLINNVFKYPFISDIQDLIYSILIDEAYHSKLIVSIIKKYSDLSFRLPKKFKHGWQKSVEKCYNDSSTYQEKKLKNLILAIAAESYISDTLKLFKNKEIQPLNLEFIKLHLNDELIHNRIYRIIGACVYNAINEQEKTFFDKTLSLFISYFLQPDLNTWNIIFREEEFSKYSKLLTDIAYTEEKEIQRSVIFIINDIHNIARTFV